MKDIPCVVKEYNDRDVKEISIIENLQREDLNAIEMAKAFKSLMDEYQWTQEKVAERMGKSRSMIANTVRLLQLQPEVIAMIEEGKLSAGSARSLVIITDRDMQIKLAKQAAEKKLTVRDVEDVVKGAGGKAPAAAKKMNTLTPELREFVLDMQKVLGTKVGLDGTVNRGRITIDYYNREDLERIYKVLIDKKDLV